MTRAREFEGAQAITPIIGGNPSTQEMEYALREGWVEVVGPTQFTLMERAKVGRSWEIRAFTAGADLMIEGERERLAARRLVERGILRYHFPGAGPGMPQRRFFSLTRRGRECWIVQRWDGQ